MKFVDKKDFNSIFYISGVFIFILFFIFTLAGEDGLIRLYQLHKLSFKLKEENTALMREQLEYINEQQSLHNIDNIEYLARQQLGLVFPNETVYLVNSKKKSTNTL